MLALTTLAMIAALQGSQQTQDFHWSGTLAAGKTISIRNVNGDVRAVAASGNQVEVTGIKHARRSDPASVQIKVEQTDEGAIICVLYPNQQGNSCEDRRSNGRNNDNNDVSVDFTVHVPSSVLLSAHTVNGDVSAEGLGADAEIGTVNGDASVETNGFAEASSVNGSVDVVMGRADWSGSANYRSVNGPVSVTLPDGASTEVRASTVNGDIDTDFPLTVRGKFGPRSLRGTIGNGGRTLAIETVNGSINIRKK
ncbi:MAG TPA: DUF4097 family beta strand repeat-containing protein [Gemmatimonadales bacterium]|nr:DUF4097 family beta strand repeat-containing protein [Gemmatimonadales bacterium]